MGARTRKAIGGVGIVMFLFAYVAIAVSIGVRLPDQWAVRLIYYAVVGGAWGLPVIPLITWMNRGR